MSQPSVSVTETAAPLPMDGIGKSPIPTKSEGAFEAPKAVTVPMPDGQQKVIEPTTKTMSFNTGTGEATQSNKPVEIPKNTQWQQPMKLAEAKVKHPAGSTFKAVATYILDGDGTHVKSGAGDVIDCRVSGIDAPETAKVKYGKKGQDYGEESKSVLKNKILGREINVTVSYPVEGTQVGRNRAICQIEFEGRNINHEMVGEGAAWAFTRFSKDPVIEKLEAKAKSEKRGMWANPNIIKPSAHRFMEDYGKK